MRKLLLATMALAGMALSVPNAQAAAILIATISGNDCSGVFGTGANCTTSGTFNGTPLNSSPIMAKFDYGNDGSISSVLTGAAFPSITGSEFNLTLGATGFISYTYAPGVGDPLIQYVAVKGSNSFNLFAVGGSFGESNLFTPINNGGNRAGVSHITFYDTAGPTPLVSVPEPASMLLFGAGLLGLGLVRRARNAA